MSKKDTDKGKVVNLLKSEHFGKPGITTPDSGDPVMETTMVLTLDQLVEYDGNPRNAPNSEYEALKASYLKTGAANTLLVVTKRPGEEFYFPAAGGNTRLRVLRELWDELRDERFYRINCKFIPFKDETRVLVDHLSENVIRGDYIFIDHAKGVMKVYDQMKSEHNGTLSYREFIRQVGDLGYSLSPAQLSRFQNGVDYYGLIPQVLDAGMTGRAVRKLNDVHNDLKSFLDSSCGVNPAVAVEFERFWEFILQDMDSPEGIDLDVLTGRIFESVAPTAAERFLHLDDGQVVARLKHLWPQWRKDRSIPVSLRHESSERREDLGRMRTGPSHVYTEEEIDAFSREQGYSGNASPETASDGSDSSQSPGRPGRLPGGERGSVDTFNPESSDDVPASGSTSTRNDPHSPPGHPPGTDDRIERAQRQLDPLWLESSKLAGIIAVSWGLADLFHDIGKLGNGYFVDLPEPDHSMDSFTRIAWWLLWDISSITTHSNIISQHLDNIFRDTQIALNWHAIADGRASVKKQELNALAPEGRNATILRIFRNVVNTTVQRSDEHATFLVLMDSSRYESLTRFLDVHRQAHALKIAAMNEMGGRR